MTGSNEKQALLVMDVQPNILERIPNSEDYLALVRKAVDFAHQKEIPVLYVVVGFRPGMPEGNPRNKAFGSMPKERIDAMTEAHPVITPIDGDVVVTKRRFSAFTGSDLAVLLRSKNIEHLILAGISTSGVVLSTVREAADKDYRMTILSDLCADSDAEVHSILMNKVLPRQADIVSSEAWMSQA